MAGGWFTLRIGRTDQIKTSSVIVLNGWTTSLARCHRPVSRMFQTRGPAAL